MKLMGLAWILLAAFAQAGVLVVAPTGAPFTEIQSAVDAAQEGDTILVKSGNYASFVISARTITVAGDEGAGVVVGGAIRVRNLSGNQRVALINLSAVGVYASTGFGQYGLYATNNSGALRVQNCLLRGAAGTAAHPSGYAGAWLENCTDAAISNSTCLGGTGKDGWAGLSEGTGGEGIYASGSVLAANKCTAWGGNGLSGTNCMNSPDGGNGGHGMRSLGSVVWITSGDWRGGQGGDGIVPTSGCSCLIGAYGGVAGNALNANGNSVIFVQQALEYAGIDGDSYGSFCAFIPGGPGTVRSGLGYVNLSGSARRAETTPIRRESQNLLVNVTGTAGDQVYMLMSPTPTSATYINQWQGMQLVNRGIPMHLMLLGTLPSTGTATFGIAGQDLGSGVDSRTMHLQLLVDSASGQRQLGGALTVLQLDSAY